MAKWFGAHYNQEVHLSSAVKCMKGPQVLTSLHNQRRNCYYYIGNMYLYTTPRNRIAKVHLNLAHGEQWAYTHHNTLVNHREVLLDTDLKTLTNPFRGKQIISVHKAQGQIKWSK